MENGHRELSVEELLKLVKFFNLTTDQIIHIGNEVPKEITLEDKTANEQVRLISELEEKDKTIVFGMIEIILTKKKFKDFFHKNVATL